VSDTDYVQAIRDYYLNHNGAEPSIYHIWERGLGRGDVTTPATSDASYQQWMGALLRGLLAESPDPGLLSRPELDPTTRPVDRAVCRRQPRPRV
jgi:hypothetical protein